ncbi:MAG: hypothetical protein LUI87_08245 [Lachnospiraceae bacterium]|nr:hypothetical protein [Lachnospiraceae bacterium]
MIYETTGPVGISSAIICLLILWILFRSEKKKKRKLEEQRHRENLETSRKAKETAKQMEEEKRKRKEREKEIEAEIRTVETYLTDEQNEKRVFCTEKSGDFAISGNAIYMLHQVGVERQEILDLLGNGSKKHYDVFSMNKQDQERMEYCKKWLGVGEAEVYAIGIEIYWEYLTQ